MRLIDADAFIWWVDDYYDCTELGQIVIEWINDRPTIEPKRGRWIEETHETWAGGKATVCSACGYGYAVDAFFEVEAFNYCPNCGAKMEASDD